MLPASRKESLTAGGGGRYLLEPVLQDKAKAIQHLVQSLRERFGETAFDVVDQWDGDLLAIGLSRPGAPRFLAYVLRLRQSPVRFYVELEAPPPASGPGSELPYSVAGTFEALTTDDAIEVIVEYLGLRDGQR